MSNYEPDCIPYFTAGCGSER